MILSVGFRNGMVTEPWLDKIMNSIWWYQSYAAGFSGFSALVSEFFVPRQREIAHFCEDFPDTLLLSNATTDYSDYTDKCPGTNPNPCDP
jgi:hypothetical protein